jgi:hypothetical protein
MAWSGSLVVASTPTAAEAHTVRGSRGHLIVPAVR